MRNFLRIVVILIPVLFILSCVRAGEEWVNLIGDDGLTHWSTLSANEDHEWRVVGSVGIDESDPKRFSIREGTGVIQNGDSGRTKNIFSDLLHSDCEAHIEFTVPKGSNSGIYFMSHYEIQVLDSWGVKSPKHSDCGGIYERWDNARPQGKRGFEGHPPRVNASKAPGEWQTFDVIFRGPRFDDQGKKIANARFEKVIHNGQLVHENVEVTGPTRAAARGPEKAFGPLMLQGDHGPVAYRNIQIRPLNQE